MLDLREFLVASCSRAALLSFVHLSERLERDDILPHDILLHIPRQLLGIVLENLLVADVEDNVKFFQGQVLGFGEQEVTVNPAEDVPRGVLLVLVSVRFGLLLYPRSCLPSRRHQLS